MPTKRAWHAAESDRFLASPRIDENIPYAPAYMHGVDARPADAIVAAPRHAR
jgi:hypothetical protein